MQNLKVPGDSIFRLLKYVRNGVRLLGLGRTVEVPEALDG